MRSEMKRRLSMLIAVLAAFVAWGPTLPTARAAQETPGVLDKLVAVIDESFIITQSDIRKERAIQTALGASPATDGMILDALIERRLMETQLAQFRPIEIEAAAVEERLRSVTPPPGVSVAELRDAITGEMRRYEFVVLRFRQFIRVTDEEARTYFEQVAIPELRAKGAPIPSTQEGIELVRPNVIAEKMNIEVGDWLKELRRRSNVEKIIP